MMFLQVHNSVFSAFRRLIWKAFGGNKQLDMCATVMIERKGIDHHSWLSVILIPVIQCTIFIN